MRKRVFSFQLSVISNRPAQNYSGFSLLELLVVIAIIMMLAVFMLPAMKGISGGTNLTAATEEFVGVVNLARQRSSTFNRQVAIRFWSDSASGPYRSYQLWEQKDLADPASWQSIEAERKLPIGIIITNSASYSSLLTRYKGTTNSRTYADALFTPSGALVASSGQTSVTFVPEFGPQNGGMVSGLPPNFGVVDINAMNSIPTIYRPN